MHRQDDVVKKVVGIVMDNARTRLVALEMHILCNVCA